jgi:hypothetical protein
MIYRGPDFLAVGPTLPSVSSIGDAQETEKERQLADRREGDRGEGGAKSYDCKKPGPLYIIHYSLQ